MRHIALSELVLHTIPEDFIFHTSIPVNHTDQKQFFFQSYKLTIACSILLSMATTLAPDELQKKRQMYEQQK